MIAADAKTRRANVGANGIFYDRSSNALRHIEREIREALSKPSTITTKITVPFVRVVPNKRLTAAASAKHDDASNCIPFPLTIDAESTSSTAEGEEPKLPEDILMLPNMVIVEVQPPPQSLWAGGCFPFAVWFSDVTYPFDPPLIRYIGQRPLFHPQVESDSGERLASATQSQSESQDRVAFLRPVPAGWDVQLKPLVFWHAGSVTLSDIVSSLEEMFDVSTCSWGRWVGSRKRAETMLMENPSEFARIARTWQDETD